MESEETCKMKKKLKIIRRETWGESMENHEILSRKRNVEGSWLIHVKKKILIDREKAMMKWYGRGRKVSII